MHRRKASAKIIERKIKIARAHRAREISDSQAWHGAWLHDLAEIIAIRRELSRLLDCLRSGYRMPNMRHLDARQVLHFWSARVVKQKFRLKGTILAMARHRRLSQFKLP